MTSPLTYLCISLNEAAQLMLDLDCGVSHSPGASSGAWP